MVIFLNFSQAIFHKNWLRLNHATRQHNHYAFLFMASHAGSGNCSLELLSSWKQQKWTIMSFNLSAQRKTDSVTQSDWSLKIVGPIFFLHNNTLQDQKSSNQKDHYSIASYGGRGVNGSINTHSIEMLQKKEWISLHKTYLAVTMTGCLSLRSCVSTFLNQTISLLKSKLRSKNLHYNRVQMYLPVYLSTLCG